jgi:methylated-DNA-[protein]-cysteine S-methyltransferase
MSKTKTVTAAGSLIQSYYCYYTSPVGKLLLAGDELGLSRIQFESDNQPASPESNWQKNSIQFQQTIIQLDQYFNKSRKTFNLKLNPKGTDFQQQVWSELQNIEYGQTNSYLDIAEKIGNPKASRAVGMANNKNPIPIIIPCHRVIGKNGSLVGFAGGLSVKQKLLELEFTF